MDALLPWESDIFVFKPGERVVYRFKPPGGYGLIVRQPGVVMRATKARVTVRLDSGRVASVGRLSLERAPGAGKDGGK